MPADSHREHSEPRAQVAGHQFHGSGIAAMAGDENELAQPATRQTLAEFRPDRDRGRRRQRQRSGVRQMFNGNTDALHRKKRHWELIGQNFADPRHIGFGDKAVDAER